MQEKVHQPPVALAASTFAGYRIRNHDGEELGKVRDVVIDLEAGRVAYVAVQVGGFLGMNDRLLAVPWEALHVDTVSKQVMLNVEPETLQNQPTFQKDKWPATTGDDRQSLQKVYEYYGFEPYWTEDGHDGEDQGQ
jgi:sporulation protein YlmC with PRC-barrel domain